MFCSHCGKQLDSSSRFCSGCGADTATPAAPRGGLVRPLHQRMIGGVCAALALHYGWDLTATRLVAACLVIFFGTGVLAYLVAWLIIPAETVPIQIKSA